MEDRELPGPPLDIVPIPGGDSVSVLREERYPGRKGIGWPTFLSEREFLWHAEHWEHAEHIGAESSTLEKMAFLAARFDNTTRRYRDLLPREGADFDHDEIVYNVVTWVEYALTPDTLSGREPRGHSVTLEWIGQQFQLGRIGPRVTRYNVSPQMFKNSAGVVKQISTLTGLPLRFVCIEHAVLAAALIRRLGYHVQDFNVVSGVKLSWVPSWLGRDDDIWTYQSAAIRVWYHGRWNYFDPYLYKRDQDATILATVTSKQTRILTNPTTNEKQLMTESSVAFYRWKTFVSPGYLSDDEDWDATNTVTSLQWDEIEDGKYRHDRGLYDRKRKGS